MKFVNDQDSEKKHFYHKSCYRYACCKICKSKENLYHVGNPNFYCDECFKKFGTFSMLDYEPDPYDNEGGSELEADDVIYENSYDFYAYHMDHYNKNDSIE